MTGFAGRGSRVIESGCSSNLAERLERGLALHRAGRLAEAEAIYKEILELEPRYADAHCLLGIMAQQARDHEQAVRYLERAVECDDTVADYHNNLGAAYRCSGKLSEAIASYRKAIALRPGYAEAHSNLGIALDQVGEVEAAFNAFRRALALRPDYATPYFHLAEMRRYASGDPLIREIESLLARENLEPQDRVALHFALAKICDDCDDFDRAFAHARQANELDRTDFDLAATESSVTRAVSVFTPELFASRSSYGNDSELPVFIVGMPRSGKSLVEHILRCHPEVHGAGELDDVNRIAVEMPKLLETELKYPECVPLLDGDTAGALAESYVEHLRELGGPVLRVVDTVPGNLLRLGLITLLFPRCRIIHCRRHPLDVGLACYLRHINASQPFASRLEDIGGFHREYERLMAHWRAVLPVPMLEVDYETLVTGFGSTARRIVEFCGLDWSDMGPVAPYRSRPVRTHDLATAASPVDRSFLGRWTHYEHHLEPLKAALGMPVV